METKKAILIIEKEDDNLFQRISDIQSDLNAQRADFRSARETLREQNPDIVIFNLDHQRQEVYDILDAFHDQHPNTAWILSGDNITSEELLRFMRLGVIDYLKQPLNPVDFLNLLRRIEDTQNHFVPGKKSSEPHHIISFFSPKGGVGVSFTAVNTAIAMARRNFGRVLLADFVLQHGNIPELLDMQCHFTVLDVIENIERMDRKLLENSLQRHSSGTWILPCPKQPEQSEFINAKETGDMLKIFKNAFNYTLIDVGHELNTASIACLDHSDLIFLISTPDLPSLYNAKIALQTFKKLGYKKTKVRFILNRWHMKGEIDIQTIEKNLGYPIYHRIADDHVHVVHSMNQGIPLCEANKKSETSKCIEKMLDRIVIAATKGE